MEADKRVAVIVLRIWKESNGDDGLRIRIVRSHDVAAAGEPRTSIVASVDEACRLIGEWLESWTAGSGG